MLLDAKLGSVGDSPEYATQDRVFTYLGQPIVDNAFSGFNCTLFAYGQTGAGKSYSVIGLNGSFVGGDSDHHDDDDDDDDDTCFFVHAQRSPQYSGYGANTGIVVRVCDKLFQTMSANKCLSIIYP